MRFPKSAKWLAATVLIAALGACQGMPEPPRSLGNQAPAAQNLAPQNTQQQNVTTFAFEPFTGAPGNIADDLSKAIGSQARRQGLVLVRRVGATATYRINGYLSATGSPSSATVFYVFDIVDGNGSRVKRISGTEIISGASGDPWTAVDSDTLERIAARSVVEIDAWANRR